MICFGCVFWFVVCKVLWVIKEMLYECCYEDYVVKVGVDMCLDGFIFE